MSMVAQSTVVQVVAAPRAAVVAAVAEGVEAGAVSSQR